MTVQRGGFALTGIILVLAALDALSAPTGGPVSWHVTNGVSMLPGITKGTLVVVHRKDAYDVGDVVAYDSTELGKVVLHRVPRVEADRLVMTRDNNSWIDPETPAAADALGSRVFQLKGVGPAVDGLRRPVALAGGAVVLALALLQTSSATRRRRRGRSPGAGAAGDRSPAAEVPPPQPAPAARRPARLPSVPAGADTALRVGVGCCALLAIAATTGPFLDTTASASTAQQVVTWEYGAEAPPGLAYPGGAVATGDQLYPRLVTEADVTAELEVDVPDGTTVSGTWRLDVSAENDDGWSRTTFTGAPATVSTAPTRLTTTVPLRELLEMAGTLTRETGVEAGGLRLVVTAVLDLELVTDGVLVPQQATSVLAFDADAKRVGLEKGSQLVQTSSLPLPSAGATTTSLRLVGVTLPPGPTRMLALAGTALICSVSS
ncbi:MAG: peptidase signal peptidase [Frankiales bacterium]|nr:peptidase signal peptidase [Frankiales bacterium]